MSFTKLLIVSELFSVVWLLGVCCNECRCLCWMLALLELGSCWVFGLFGFHSPLSSSGIFIYYYYFFLQFSGVFFSFLFSFLSVFVFVSRTSDRITFGYDFSFLFFVDQVFGWVYILN